jgi:heparan-sulfate lyase
MTSARVLYYRRSIADPAGLEEWLLKKALVLALMLAVVVPTSAAPASAGADLDRILNHMILDASNGGVNRGDHKTVSPENPVGQTFLTGPDTIEVSRIAVAVAYWHESWTEDKSLVLTLWDSPEKKQRIASAEMPFKWKAWEGQVIMFTLDAKVRPNAQYYFELTAKGGDGRIVGVFLGESYEGGHAYEAGKPSEKNIWFEVHSRPALDRDKAYADRFAMWNLDYPGLEKVRAAVAGRDWDSAVDELIRYYEAKPELVDPAMKPRKVPDYDASYAELVLDMKIKDDAGNIVDLGPNWNHYRTWPTRGGVGLTRSGIMKDLAGAYRNTADEKFARGFNDLVLSMLRDMPSPLRAGAIRPDAADVNPAPPAGIRGGSMWSGLSIGARMNQIWYFYSSVASSPSFTRDARAGMIFNMADMAAVLSIYKGGGNWESQMSTALYELAERHPELARSKEWFNKGLTTMVDNLWETSRADGSVQEPTYNYTNLIINRYRHLLDTCKKLSIPLERKYINRVERTIEYLMYNTEPNGDLPSRGDTFNFVNSREQLIWGADYYGRSDFRYVATGGRQGSKPSGTSRLYPIGGWCVMRSGWDPDALYLQLHNGKDMGHGHADALAVSVDAFGSKLIVDPGCYTYGTPYQSELYKSRKHATVTVDDADAHTEHGANALTSFSTVDYYAGTNAGYRGLDGVSHTRKITFMKPDYWMIEDTIAGAGEHEVASRFPFLPGAVELDAKTGVCRTLNPGGNISIIPVPDNGLSAELYAYDFPRDGLEPAKGLKYSAKTSLPARTAYALVPHRGSQAPRVDVAKLAASCYKVSRDGWTDYVCFGDASCPEITFEGEALVLRLDGRGRVRSLNAVNGTQVKLGATTLVSVDRPLKSLEVALKGDVLCITTPTVEPSLRISSLGASKFRVGAGAERPAGTAVIVPFLGN